MSILDSIEAEFQAIASSAKTTVEKLEAFVGLHQKAQELTGLRDDVMLIVNDVTKATSDKADAIIDYLRGKL